MVSLTMENRSPKEDYSTRLILGFTSQPIRTMQWWSCVKSMGLLVSVIKECLLAIDRPAKKIYVLWMKNCCQLNKKTMWDKFYINVTFSPFFKCHYNLETYTLIQFRLWIRLEGSKTIESLIKDFKVHRYNYFNTHNITQFKLNPVKLAKHVINK